MPNIYVRRLNDREIVDRVIVMNPYPRKVERIVRGMLINMNRDEYFVDSSECDLRMEEDPNG